MTTLSGEQQAVLEAITLRSQVEARSLEVEESDKRAAASVVVAEQERDATIAKANTVAAQARKEAEAQYTDTVTAIVLEPVGARERLAEAEQALGDHLQKVLQQYGIRLDWLNRSNTPGGRVTL